MTALPRWIRTSQDVAALAAHLARSPAIALDTEADSLHHYPKRLCLVQVADATGAAYLVDPFSPADLSPLGAVLADPAVLKVVHAGDNDLAALKRRHGFAFASLFDTYIAARFLGGEELGVTQRRGSHPRNHEARPQILAGHPWIGLLGTSLCSISGVGLIWMEVRVRQ